jgi:AraC-like DNA-binding protein
MSLPVIPPARFFAYSQRLHYCVTGEKIAFVDIHHDTPEAKHLILEEPNTEENFHVGVYAAELELFKMIEGGNLNYEPALNKAASVATGGIIDVAGDPNRKSEVLAITFITLSVRAAIRGSLHPATAYSLGDYYLSVCLQCDSISELTNVLHTMFQDFVTRVHSCRTNSDISKPIQACCDYINMHAYKKINLEELSNVVGYARYYLTRKFKKELGISVWDYIHKVKVERAKTMLANPSYTIQYISNALNYCSRNYFSEVFQKHAGISPSKYREIKLNM